MEHFIAPPPIDSAQASSHVRHLALWLPCGMPLLAYLIAPGMLHSFPTGEYTGGLERVFTWDAWSVAGLAAIFRCRHCLRLQSARMAGNTSRRCSTQFLSEILTDACAITVWAYTQPCLIRSGMLIFHSPTEVTLLLRALSHFALLVSFAGCGCYEMFQIPEPNRSTALLLPPKPLYWLCRGL